MSEISPYQATVILDVTNETDWNNIKKAFKSKAIEYHPDKSSDANSEEKFKLVAEAYDVLKRYKDGGGTLPIKNQPILNHVWQPKVNNKQQTQQSFLLVIEDVVSPILKEFFAGTVSAFNNLIQDRIDDGQSKFKGVLVNLFNSDAIQMSTIEELTDIFKNSREQPTEKTKAKTKKKKNKKVPQQTLPTQSFAEYTNTPLANAKMESAGMFIVSYKIFQQYMEKSKEGTIQKPIFGTLVETPNDRKMGTYWMILHSPQQVLINDKIYTLEFK